MNEAAPIERQRKRPPTPPKRLGARRGRPSTYDEETVRIACVAARAGATVNEIAAEMGVSVDTLYVWQHDRPDFAEALKAAKDAYDERVEHSLASRALGYSHTVEKVFANGFRTTVVEHVPPDVTAQIFWLKNRRPDRWRDRKELDIAQPAEQKDGPSIRQLALAALALIAAAQYGADEPEQKTIDATPNPEPTEDADDAPFDLDP